LDSTPNCKFKISSVYTKQRLSAAFIDSEGKILNIFTGNSVDSYYRKDFSFKENIIQDAILFVPYNWFSKNGIRKGDVVRWQ
jgi:uncharacterized membrane protein (UPF0127 family)